MEGTIGRSFLLVAEIYERKNGLLVKREKTEGQSPVIMGHLIDLLREWQ